MAKITLIENTGLIRIKFEKTLAQYGYQDIITVDTDHVFMHGMVNQIKGSTLIFLDGDHKLIKYPHFIHQLHKVYGNDIQLIIFTTEETTKDLITWKSLGANGILLKPYSETKLMKQIFQSIDRPSIKDINKYTSKIDPQDNQRYMPEWNSDFELGIEVIDDQHRQLIEHFETLYQKMRLGKGHEYCLETIDFLTDYVDFHFKSEEEMLKEIDYPNLNDHHEKHEIFKKELASIANEYKSTTISNTMLIKFSLFLKNWLVHHILITDHKYGEVYHKLKDI